MSPETRYDAPLMLGLVSHDNGLDRFTAVKFDRDLRGGVEEVLQIMRDDPAFDPLNYPPPPGLDPEEGPSGSSPIVGVLLPEVESALTWESGAMVTYIEHGLLVHGDRLVVISPVSTAHSYEVGHKIVASISPTEYDDLSPAERSDLIAAIGAVPPEALNDSLSDDFHTQANLEYLRSVEGVILAASSTTLASLEHLQMTDSGDPDLAHSAADLLPPPTIDI